MFSLLPPQKGMLVGVKNTALRNVLFLVYACIQKPDNTLKMAFQTNLTPTSIHCSHNQGILSVFLPGLAVPVSWAVQLEFVSSGRRYRIPNSAPQPSTSCYLLQKDTALSPVQLK